MRFSKITFDLILKKKILLFSNKLHLYIMLVFVALKKFISVSLKMTESINIKHETKGSRDLGEVEMRK